MDEKVIKGYKGFNKDMTCRGFQYEEGVEYECADAEICKRGFHFCENPIDIFGYYSPCDSVFHAVEGSGKFSREEGDSKIACTHIRIGTRLNIAELVKITFNYVKNKCTKNKNAGDYGAANAGDRGAANAGDYGAANAGYRGAANAGDYGAANAGDYGAANAGNRGAANAGDCGAANAGDYGAANAGDYGAANAGDRGAATSRGKSSVENHGIAVARGNGCRVKGGIGSILVVAEEDTNSYTIRDWKAVMVDGVKIKADTWYLLKDGKLIEDSNN